MCLNPCFSGNRFGSSEESRRTKRREIVLILVLVEIGLRDILSREIAAGEE